MTKYVNICPRQNKNIEILNFDSWALSRAAQSKFKSAKYKKPSIGVKHVTCWDIILWESNMLLVRRPGLHSLVAPQGGRRILARH